MAVNELGSGSSLGNSCSLLLSKMKNTLFCKLSSLFSPTLHLELTAAGQKSGWECALSMFSYSDNLISPFMNSLGSLNSEDSPFQFKRRGKNHRQPDEDDVLLTPLAWLLCLCMFVL